MDVSEVLCQQQEKLSKSCDAMCMRVFAGSSFAPKFGAEALQ
jgi:hypothetical protein